MAELVEHLVGNLGICCDVSTVNLDIDRCRQAEVQSLGDNIGGKKVKRGSGIFLWQFVTKSPDVIGGSVVLLFEGNQNVCIRCSGQARAAIDVVDVAVGKTDDIEDVIHLRGKNRLTNATLDQVHQTRGLLNTGSCLRTHMQNKLAAVRVREKILAKKRNQSKRQETNNKKAWNKGEPNRNKLRQQRGVGEANFLKVPLERSLKTGKNVTRGRNAMVVRF